MKSKIDGVLLLNKPIGMSSNTALQKVKRIYNAQKAGHTGTLDPLADGLLPICFGEATKFSSFLLEGDKEYIATVKLGQETATYDAEGEITAENEVDVSFSQIHECLMNFIGEITQTPPIYSALKVNGKKLYEYARSGEEVVIKSRQITIREIELLQFIAPDMIKLRVLCTKGTYIRSLAHDIGQKLGTYAHLTGLTRTKSNQFILNEKISLELLSALSPEQQQELLMPHDVMLQHLPVVNLSDAEFFYVKNGHQFSDASELHGQVRLYYTGVFLGVANIDNAIIKPVRLISNCGGKFN